MILELKSCIISTINTILLECDANKQGRCFVFFRNKVYNIWLHIKMFKIFSKLFSHFDMNELLV